MINIDSSEELMLFEPDERDCILELLIQDAVDNNNQRAIKLLKSLRFIDPDGFPITIDWDMEIGNIKAKLKKGEI